MAQNYGLIRSLDEFKALVDYLYKIAEKGGVVSFDTEGGYLGPDRPKGSLDVTWSRQFTCGFSLSGNPGMARYTAVAHDDPEWNLPEEQVWEIARPLLETVPVVAHNAKFEIKNLALLDKKGRGPRIDLNIVADTMLIPYVLSEWQRVGQKDLVREVFNHEQTAIKSLFPQLTAKAEKTLRFNTLSLSQEVIEYACEDAAWCLALYHALADKAKLERGFMFNLEHQIMRLMADVEIYGAYVDWAGLTEAQQQAAAFVERMEKSVRQGLTDMVGRDLSDLNLGSSAQLRDVLYEPPPIGLGLAASRFSDKTGIASTDAIALEKLSRQIPPIKKLLELREVNNLSRRIGKWINEQGTFAEDGRVHASYGQTIVPTGRFAANEPAIQQCPKEWRWVSDYTDFNVWEKEDQDKWQSVVDNGVNGLDYWNGNFRDFIMAAPGFYFLTYDYSQIELRVLAGMTQEPALLRAFNEGIDVHAVTASKMLGKPIDEVSSKDRAIGKTMNFALIYGMGPKSLSDRLALSQEKATELYEEYFAQFPSVSSWMERTKSIGKSQGYVETYFGRKMTAWELQSQSRAMYAKGLRVLGNYPIQGGAADYMKIAMVRVRERLVKEGWWGSKCTIIMNQHDSLTFEVSNDLNPVDVRALIEPAVVFDVPVFPKIVADWELGQRWGSSTPWKAGLAPEWDGQKWSLSQVPTETEEPAQPPAVPMPLMSSPQSTLIIEAEWLTHGQLDDLMNLCGEKLGTNKVVFRTSGKKFAGGATEIEIWDGTGLSLADQGTISVIIPNAVCKMPGEEVDPVDVVGSLEL